MPCTSWVGFLLVCQRIARLPISEKDNFTVGCVYAASFNLK